VRCLALWFEFIQRVMLAMQKKIIVQREHTTSTDKLLIAWTVQRVASDFKQIKAMTVILLDCFLLTA